MLDISCVPSLSRPSPAPPRPQKPRDDEECKPPLRLFYPITSLSPSHACSMLSFRSSVTPRHWKGARNKCSFREYFSVPRVPLEPVFPPPARIAASIEVPIDVPLTLIGRFFPLFPVSYCTPPTKRSSLEIHAESDEGAAHLMESCRPFRAYECPTWYR